MASSEHELYTAMHTTTTTFLNSYATAHASQDPSQISTALSLICIRHLAPSSFAKAASLDAGRTNEQYELHIQPELAMASAAQVRTLDIAVDATKKRAAARSVKREPTSPSPRTKSRGHGKFPGSSTSPTTGKRSSDSCRWSTRRWPASSLSMYAARRRRP